MDLPFLATPSISPAAFARVLTDARSPAAPEAAACYDLLIAYGLDPAVALAIFLHESSLGLAGSAARTRNWGNIRVPQRRAAWGRCLNPTARGAMARYASWRDGLDAWAQLITQIYVPTGRATVATAIPSYAPAGPPDFNQPQVYIAAVIAAVSGWRALDRPVADRRMAAIGDGTRVRQWPRLDAPVLRRLRAGQIVTVDHIIADGAPVPSAGDSRRWAHIVAPSVGWVAAYLLEEVPA